MCIHPPHTHTHTRMSMRLPAYSAYLCVWVDWGCWACCSETGAVPEPRNFSAGAADGGADSASRQRHLVAAAVRRTRRPRTAACRCVPTGRMEWGPAVGFGKLESWATGALKHSGTRGLHGATKHVQAPSPAQSTQHTHCQQKTHQIMNSPRHTVYLLYVCYCNSSHNHLCSEKVRNI